MSFVALRLSLHPSSARTKSGTRILKVANKADEVIGYRELSDYLTRTWLVLPKDQAYRISLGESPTGSYGDVEYAAPVSIDPRAQLGNDSAMNIRVAAVREFEKSSEASRYVEATVKPQVIIEDYAKLPEDPEAEEEEVVEETEEQEQEQQEDPAPPVDPPADPPVTPAPIPPVPNPGE